MLDNPNEPVSDLSYFDCIESVMENSKVGLLQSRAHRRFLFFLFFLFALCRFWENPWLAFL